MNKITTKNFNSWYSKIDPEPSSDLVEKRLAAIDKIIDIKRRDFWIDLVRGYLRLPHLKSETNNDLVTLFKDSDPSFPLTKNEKLLEILTAIILATKLADDNKRFNRLIALLITNNQILQKKKIDQTIPVITSASNYLSSLELSQSKLSFSDIDEKIQSLEETFTGEDSESSELVFEHKECAEVISVIGGLRDNQKRLTVELNVLWWLFGQYSRNLNKSFKQLGILNMIMVGAYEISDAVLGIQDAKAMMPILHKALALTDKEKLSDPVSILDLLTRSESAVIGLFSKLGEGDLFELTPMLSAFHSSKSTQSSDLLKRLKSINKQIDFEKKIKPQDMAHQLFNEIISLNNFDE
jgi:hypothetical protein